MIINKDGEFSGLEIGSMELDLFKADDISKVGYDAKFDGVASTERLDREGQKLIQKGLNFDSFKKYGYFNDNHSKGAMVAEAVGDKAVYNADKNCWHVFGRFLPYVAKAQQYVDLAKSFAHNKSPMTLRLSVEGKASDVSDDGKIVRKADIHRVAITLDPVNVDTNLKLLFKSMFHEDNEEKLLTIGDKERRILVAFELSKSMKCSMDTALEYYDKYSLQLN